MTSVPFIHRCKLIAAIAFICFIASGSFNTVLAQDAGKGNAYPPVATLNATIQMDVTDEAESTNPTQTINYKGKTFIFTGVVAPDTTVVEDPITGEEKYVITTRDPILLTMNGVAIYNAGEQDDIEEINNAKQKLNSSINIILKNQCKQLDIPAGGYTYHIANIVVDKQGDIVYLEPSTKILSPITVYDLGGNEIIRQQISEEANKKLIAEIVKAVEMTNVGKMVMDNESKVYTFHLSGDYTVL